MNWAHLATLDWLLLAVLALSVGVGLWRGLVFEVLSLVAWVVAWVVAEVWGPALAVGLPLGASAAALRATAGFALAFVGALVACSLLARLARMLVAATPLSLIDRMLGGGFGLLRGLLILLVAATLVALTPAAHSPIWQASQGAAWLDGAVQALRPLLPDGMGRPLGA